jgi:crossover junction endodeoxyribonuclease RuvC
MTTRSRATDVSGVTGAVVLGIDPGLRSCGWGVVAGGGERARLVGCGAIRPRPGEPLGARLMALHAGVAGVISAHRPDEVAVEDPFVGATARGGPAAALAIGGARAVAVLAAAQAGLEVVFYAPAAVKVAVSGYGRGEKRQVQAMVRILLGLNADPEPSDAADALAVALCHLNQRRLGEITAS